MSKKRAQFSLTMILCGLALTFAPAAFGQEAGGGYGGIGDLAGPIGAGLAVIGAGLGIGRIGGSATEALSRITDGVVLLSYRSPVPIRAEKAPVARIGKYTVHRLVTEDVVSAAAYFLTPGVAAAMLIPIQRPPGAPKSEDSPLHKLEHGLAPWVAFLVLPIFGFANAGVPLEGITFADFLAPAPLGVAAGLFFGKQIGVLIACWIARWPVALSLASSAQVASTT